VKSRTLMCISTITLFTMLALPLQVAAQHIRYKLVDIPTLGGPSAGGNVDCNECAQFINNPGVVVGGAATSIHDPNAPNCGNCFLGHGFRWQDGILTDLGALLPGVNFSHATSINARGWSTGGSGIAEIDPQTGNPQEHAVLWKGTEIVDLGTLRAGLDSAGLTINNAGEVVGMATVDTTIDSFPLGPWRSPTHAFIWRHGVMQDLGTLGGADSFPTGGCNNERSELVVGWSFTDSIANASTGIPTQHAFVWDHGTMTDIPTLGGSSAFAQCPNNRGQVIGQSNLTGDVGCPDSCAQHAFSWDHGTLTDLETLGGSFSLANWLNNQGEAVGGATTTNDESFHATLWKNGQITDLGTFDGDCASVGVAINSKSHVVGLSFNCDTNTLRMVLWENGSIIDLNAAIPANSSLFLAEPDNINERGEIVGRGAPPGCDPFNLDACGHVFLLIPCAGGQGCEGGDSTSAQVETPVITKTLTQRREMIKAFVARLRARLAQGHHIPRVVMPKE
jgi:probable HAF family extracellular repeat protein